MDDHKVNGIPPLSLAYLGDAVYAVYIRAYIIKSKPFLRPDALHREATRFVSAKAQSGALLHLREDGMLTEEEWDIARRARNKSSATRAKNATIKEYRNASGIEALIGYLDLTDDHGRIGELMTAIMEKGRDEDE